MARTSGAVALLWRGDPALAASAILEGNRLEGVAAALRQVGLAPQPVIFAEEILPQVRNRLMNMSAVLVWVNPQEGDRDRTVLDGILREVAAQGVVVSAHPDTILRMGTKAILYETRTLGWGCDTRLYEDVAGFRARFPACLAEGGPRVLKQYRGNGGNGVWKVQRAEEGSSSASLRPDTPLRVRHAIRGSAEEILPLQDFLDRCEGYFQGEGRIIDQPYQPRLTDGMIRCYLVCDRVAGFGEQLVNLLHPAHEGADASETPLPGPRLYYPPTRPDFQSLRRRLEQEWVPEMLRVLGLGREDLPAIWDADFLYGPKTAHGDDTYVLCEINVSSVYPFPDDALKPLALETLRRLERVA